jgi:hypothetical protein
MRLELMGDGIPSGYRVVALKNVALYFMTNSPPNVGGADRCGFLPGANMKILPVLYIKYFVT